MKCITQSIEIIAQFIACYRPLHGGKYCLGERKRYRICNVHVSPLILKAYIFN